MALTRNDREFCNLVACAYNVPVRKMPYLMYMLQEAGMDLNYRYSIRRNAIKSFGLINSLGDLVAVGYITQKYELTQNGGMQLRRYFITAWENSIIDKILYYVQIFDINQLYLLCVTDITLQDNLKKGGYHALLGRKDEIVNIISNLCVDFTMEDFNTSIKIMNELRGILNAK